MGKPHRADLGYKTWKTASAEVRCTPRSGAAATYLARRMAWAVLRPAGPPPTMHTSVLIAGIIWPQGVA